MLSYNSVHSLDQSGRSGVDSAHLHLLHLVTVAHLVQVLLTSTTGDSNTRRSTDRTHTVIYCRCLFVCLSHLSVYLSVCVEEVCMDQDSLATEEEELTCQLYNTLRKHLGR